MDDVVDPLGAFAHPPSWLVAAADGEVIAAALRTVCSQLADGPTRLDGVRPIDLRHRDGRWTGRYAITLSGPDGDGDN